jgi:hypothetical protein
MSLARLYEPAGSTASLTRKGRVARRPPPAPGRCGGLPGGGGGPTPTGVAPWGASRNTMRTVGWDAWKAATEDPIGRRREAAGPNARDASAEEKVQ